MTKISKIEPFEAFIKYLEEGSDAHWTQIAEAIGVSKDTITRWKKEPRAKLAIEKGINYALQQMQKVGSKDWRMWESKLKMLGVSPIDRSDITSEGKKLTGPVVYIPKEKKDE